MNTEAESKGTPVPEKKPEAKPKQVPADDAHEKKVQMLTRELKKVEEIIEKLQGEKVLTEAELAKPDVYSNFEKLTIVQQAFEKTDSELSDANKKWGELITDLENLGVS
jgi:ATP-binding cassette subfamily F protein 3